MNSALLHIHIDMWVTYHKCLESTAIDIGNVGRRDDIDAWILFGSVTCCAYLLLSHASCEFLPLFFCTWSLVIIISIDRVACQISTGIQSFRDDDWFTTAFLDVDSDRTIDDTTSVVSAIDILKG